MSDQCIQQTLWRQIPEFSLGPSVLWPKWFSDPLCLQAGRSPTGKKCRDKETNTERRPWDRQLSTPYFLEQIVRSIRAQKRHISEAIFLPILNHYYILENQRLTAQLEFKEPYGILKVQNSSERCFPKATPSAVVCSHGGLRRVRTAICAPAVMFYGWMPRLSSSAHSSIVF